MKVGELRFREICDDVQLINFRGLTNEDLIRIGKAIATAEIKCGQEMAKRGICVLDKEVE